MHCRTKFIVIFLFVMLASLGNVMAQGFFGLSINYGDKLTYSPDFSSLLKRRSPSPTFVYNFQQKVTDKFSVMYGAQAGIAGYQIVTRSTDTLGYANEKTGFGDFGIITGKLEVTPGLLLSMKKRKVFLGIGGGVSYYKVMYTSATYGVGFVSNGVAYETFYADVEAPPSGTFLGFAKIYINVAVSNRLNLAFQYAGHWKSILTGDFQFAYSKEPGSGTISLVPKGVSLQILYRLKKEKTG